MSEVEDSNENIWSFLLLSGYLKAVKTENIEGMLNCELEIPNKEIHIFYRNLIEKWFKETLNNQKYNTMLKAIIPKDTSKFGIIIEFKRIKDTAPKTIDEGALEALNQIEENRYEAELQDRNVVNIWKLAIVFKGKRVKIVEG